MSAILLAILSVFFPVIALFAALVYMFMGEGTLALFFFIWWVIWDDSGETVN